MANALEMVSRSDTGRLRSHNEDAVHIDPPRGLAILADGMGGYNAGEVASKMATDLIGCVLERTWAAPGQEGGGEAAAAAADSIAQANNAVYQAAQSQSQYAGMGTTLVMTLFHGDAMTVAHVGDSRLYRLRAGKLALLTRDHSLLQEQLDRGLVRAEDAHSAQNRNLVTRALGIDPDVLPDINSHELQAGDIYLLCSDGLNDMLEDADIAQTLREQAQNLARAATALVQKANDSGGRDNVSVILVRVAGGIAAPSWFARLLSWLGRRLKGQRP